MPYIALIPISNLQGSIKCSAWREFAAPVAEKVKVGMRIRISNGQLVPVNPNFAMGASSEMELKIVAQTEVDVLATNINTIDPTL